MPDTIAAVATGGCVSAIGIIRLSGKDALNIADRVFFPRDGKPMSAHADRKLVYGELRGTDGAVLDLCLGTVSRAPQSYTGENTAEFQCHGSPTVLRSALEALFAAGARQALAGEFTRRAFLNGRMDLIQAEAVIDVIEAETAEAAKNAVCQLSGAITQRTDGIYSSLVDIISHYHAVLDYPDEDIEPFELENYASVLNDACLALKRLLDTFARGRILKDGVAAAIIGRPNVGKSSLLNALLGFERAIVTDIPGTTRDTIEERIRLGGVLLRLIDTAGLRDAPGEVERLGVRRTLAAAKEAELIIAVFDGSEPLRHEDNETLAVSSRTANAIAVITKSDLPQKLTPADLPGVFSGVCTVCAPTGEGLKDLESEIARLFPLPSAPAGEILTNARQADAVSRALEALEAAKTAMTGGYTPDAVLTEAEEAMKALGELTGKSVSGDVTDRIFSRFCVGK
ncbi:MAG TPA: tRNA uridine-5-carboxymethylaminomethyl(34) synthesis GTPase MnmE [Clostridiales bacterium]|nr:tRNA uridine-5-carboxymethylaminomethyl(34) synthesis GTPase MnmE [Clostridiales bacterium]